MAEAKFKLNGKEYPIAEQFDMGEICDAEQFFGVEFEPGKSVGMRGIAATLYISIRRVDPTVTVEDIRAISADTLKELLNQLQAGEESPPAELPRKLASSEPIGEHLSNGSEDRDGAPSPTGVLGSEMSASSDQLTSPV